MSAQEEDTQCLACADGWHVYKVESEPCVCCGAARPTENG